MSCKIALTTIRYAIDLVLLGAIVLSFFPADWLPHRHSITPENCAKVHVGMSRSEVEEIMHARSGSYMARYHAPISLSVRYGFGYLYSGAELWSADDVDLAVWFQDDVVQRREVIRGDDGEYQPILLMAVRRLTGAS
jgi:hypothetical protein